MPMSLPLDTRGRGADCQCFERNASCARAQLRYFVRHMFLRLAEVVRRSCVRQVGMKCLAYLVGSVVYREF